MKTTTIFGPPGTGKTRRLVDTVAQHEGERILMLSFSKAAALETASRLPDGMNIKASTIHSLAFNHFNMSRAAMVDGKKLAEFGKEAGFPFKGSEDNSDEAQEGDDYATVLAFANNRMIDVHESYDRFKQPGTRHRFEMFLKAYRQWKKTYGYMDFDDLLLNFAKSDQFDCPPVVALDEAQDCSPLQWAAIRAVIDGGAEVMYIAGDDDQAIFEWNGADPHGMIEFGADEYITLDESYRVPSVIHEFVNKQIIPQFGRRVKKEFAAADRTGTLTRWGDLWDLNFKNVAATRYGDSTGAMILLRDRFRMDEVKRMLNREMIPYEVLGGGSPWTNRYANALRENKEVEIPLHWRSFYRMAKRGGHLNEPVNLVLSTIHQAKGREHDFVILDLTLPYRALSNIYIDRDAELRVMYVGLTRAIHTLYLCGENPLL